MESKQHNWPQITHAQAARQTWDVAIVGAGPAGSAAAIQLAERGHKTLLIDKDSFPRDKVCGDGIIPDAIASLKRAGLYEDVCRLGYATSLVTVYSPSRIEFNVPGEFLTLKRFVLDELIARKAIESGASFCRSKIIDVEAQEDGTVLLTAAGESSPLQAKIAFIATGANIDLPDKLGMVRRAGPSAVALRCYVQSKLALDRLIITYDRSITPGYAWIFPLGDGEFNAGCGVTYPDSTSPRVNLRDVFRQFTLDFPLASEMMRQATGITPLKGAMLRCGLAGAQPAGRGNLLLIGETIGATFPFTGEGIGKAMETGELAASLADEALASNDYGRLREFPELLERELRPKYRGYQIAEDWFSKPWLNDFMARRISKSRFMQEAVAGLVNETVNPREIFSLRAIIRSFLR